MKVREMTADEERHLREQAASRTQAARLVQRARLLVAMLDDPALAATKAAERVGFINTTRGPAWVKRFNAGGIAGLDDQPRPGRPRRHTETRRGELISLARQKPRELGYPFALWTEERLRDAFAERTGTRLGLSTIWRWLDEDGLRWKRQQTWFSDVPRHDPLFAEKRGPSSRPIAILPRTRG